jgi:hypothetical protein
MKKFAKSTFEEICEILPGYRTATEEAKAFTRSIQRNRSHHGIYQQGIWKIGVRSYFRETNQKFVDVGGNYDID